LNVTDGAKISVSSPAGQAGNLTITADNLLLNQGELTAETGLGNSGNNANINLTAQDLLLLRNQSLISAQAFNIAKGGNININAKDGFVVAVPVENSDINANASRGNGGRINITTQGVFGTKYRLANTNESDITASSQFGLNGQVIINTLNVDPTQGLQTFPTTVLDTSNQIAQRCSPGGKLASSQNRFTVTGKGGLSSSPDDLFTGTDALVNLLEPVFSQGNPGNAKISQSNHGVQPSEIIEAQGWIIDTQGQVHLVVDASNPLSHNPVISQVSCSHS
jgi:large exoprotein involved in heme utilization and adhesion